MKTIKIIDLLYKIANGEEVPKHILFRNYDYFFEDDEYRDFVNDCLDYDYLNCEAIICDKDEADEFEDIREITQECFDNWTCAKHINQLIKNQKKIIERLNNQDNN